jgi:hypothetical protein
MASWAVTKAVQRADVVDLAISAFGGTARFCAAIFRATFCGRSREPPNVFALPGSTARIRTPGAPAFASDDFVAPMTTTDLTSPLGQNTRNAFGHEWR